MDRHSDPDSRTDRNDDGGWLQLPDVHNPDVVAAIVSLLLSAELFFVLIWHSPYAWLTNVVLWPSIYIAVGSMLCFRFGINWIVWSLRQMPALCLVLAVALASVFWSLDPWRTFQGAMSLIGTTMIGLFIAYRLSPREMMKVFACVFLAIMAINLVVILVAPGYGIEYFPRGYVHWAWRGATDNKNSLGALAVIFALFFLAGTVTRRFTPAVGLSLSALALLLLVMAQAATATAGFIVGAAMIVAFYAGKRLRMPTLGVALVLLVMAAVAAPLIVFDPAVATAPLNRSANLTQRTSVWRDGLHLISDSPLIGYGIDAVWGLNKRTWFPDLETTRWAQTGHNGYLQLVVELGLPTGLAAIAFLAQVLWLALDQVRRRMSGFALFALSSVVASLVLNLGETRLFHRNQLIWELFVAVSATLIRLRAPLLAERSAAEAGEPSRARRRTRPVADDPRRTRRSSRRRSQAATPGSTRRDTLSSGS